MVIPFSDIPFILQSLAVPFPINANPSHICTPPKDNKHKYVSFQLTFQNAKCARLDSGIGAPNPALDQISCAYIDASLSLHDVFIYVEDSGFVQVCGKGNTLLTPIVTAVKHPVLRVGIAPYYITKPYPSDLAFPNIDLVNLFLFNHFIPPLNNANVISAIITGIPQDNFEPAFNYIPTDVFDGTFNIAAGSTSVAQNLITNTQWALSAMDINIVGATTNGDTTKFTATLNNGTTTLGTKNFILNGELSDIQLFSRSNMNYLSPSGNLTLNLSIPSGNIAADISYNLDGSVIFT